MATHSSVLAWRMPGVGEPGGLPSMGSHRVGHDWSDLTAAAVALCVCVCVCVCVQLFSHAQLFETSWTVPTRFLCPRDFPGNNTGEAFHFLLQGLLSTQGLNIHLCVPCIGRQNLYHSATCSTIKSKQYVLRAAKLSVSKIFMFWKLWDLLGCPGREGFPLLLAKSKFSLKCIFNLHA